MHSNTQTRPAVLILLSVFTLAGGQLACIEPSGAGEWPTHREVEGRVWCPNGAVTASANVGVDSGTPDDCGSAEALDAGTQTPDAGDDAGAPDSGTLEAMNLDLYGLFPNPNPVGMQVPRGALKKADDIVVDRPGVGTPRRADDPVELDVVSPVPGDPRALFDYAGVGFAWNGSSLYRMDITGGMGGSDVLYTLRGSAPWTGSLRYATAGGDMYLTGDNGPLVMDGVNAAPVVPGAPPALDLTNTYSFTTTPSGWFVAGQSVAYRIVFGFNDSDGHPVLGQPSGRYVITAPAGGPYDPTIMIDAAPGVTPTSGHFVQVYRTQPSSTDPGDTMALVYEAPWDPYLGGATMFIKDVAPYGDVPLYTNSDRGGERNSNVRPPLATDVTSFRNRLWLSNTQAPQRLRLRLIAPPPDTNHYVRIAGTTYSIDPGPAGTISQQIEYAARDLIGKLNLNANVRATYLSGIYDPPGIIQIEARSLTAAAFTAQAVGSTAAVASALFVPNVLVPVSSTADVYPNRLHYSKDGVPYAFPLSNTLQVGAQEHGIARVVALRDTLLVFKARGGDGLWKVTGSGPFYVEQVNAGVQVVAPDTVVVADNTAFAVTDKGMIAVSESGSVDIISVPIEPNIKYILLSRPSTVTSARAFVRESTTESKVYFGFPTTDADVAAESYVWNINTETWTRDTRDWRAAYVNSEGRMVRARKGEAGALMLERNSGVEVDDRAGVDYAVAWSTETGGDPSSMKQFSEVQVLFEEAQAPSVDTEVWFTADDGTAGPAVETGGEGFPYIRAEVPFDQQQTSRLGVEIRGTTTQATNIVGMSAAYRPLSTLKGR